VQFFTGCDLLVHIVTRDEYERSMERLAEQRRWGIELVETAYQAQVRALDLVWMLQGEGAGSGPVTGASSTAPSAPAPAKQEIRPPAAKPRRRLGAEVETDVYAALPRLPETFTRRDVCAALGYEPDRGALYRTLKRLVEEGHAQVVSLGDGQRPTVYRRSGGGHSSAQT
jgi:hypothetical protein